MTTDKPRTGILNIPPLTEEWFAYRAGRITSTDIAAILGVSSYRTPFEVWARLTQKTGADERKEEDEPFYLKRGRYLEPACAKLYADETGREVSAGPGLIQDEELGWLCATPDFGVDALLPGMPMNPRGVLECKAPGHFKAKEWQDEVPLEFRIQLQLNMRCWRREWGSLAALMPEDFKFWDEERNAGFLDKTLAFVQDWRERYVLKDVAPPAEARDEKLLKELMGPAQATLLALPTSLCELAHRHKELGDEARRAEKERKEVGVMLLQAMGDAQFADAGEGLYLKRIESTIHHKPKAAWVEERKYLRTVKSVPPGLPVVPMPLEVKP